MKSYKYVARDGTGRRKEGLMQAASSLDVVSRLREQSLIPVAVNEIMAKPRRRRYKRGRKKRIKSADLAALCWQLSTMLDGGIPIATALETISEDIENVQLQEILNQIYQQVRKGQPFSECAAQFPKVFNQLACAMIVAGEASGNMADAMQKLAEYFESRDKLAKKVKGAVAYPIFVFSFIVLIVIFIMAFIVPRFRTIFDQLGGQLPAFTQSFLAFYDSLRHSFPYLIGAVLLVVASIVIASKTTRGHRLLSVVVLKLPLFGKIISQAFLANFCRTMATLLAAGVSLLDVLEILSTMSKNDVVRSAVEKTRQHILSGSNISLSMAAAGFFPNMVVKMAQVGEESGSLPLVLEKTSIHYERKVDATITTMTSMLEPLMIVTVGAIVAVIVVALYLPIFTMSDFVG